MKILDKNGDELKAGQTVMVYLGRGPIPQARYGWEPARITAIGADQNGLGLMLTSDGTYMTLEGCNTEEQIERTFYMRGGFYTKTDLRGMMKEIEVILNEQE
jgi:hypothetical protein